MRKPVCWPLMGIFKGFFSTSNFENRIFAHLLLFWPDLVRTQLSVLLALNAEHHLLPWSLLPRIRVPLLSLWFLGVDCPSALFRFGCRYPWDWLHLLTRLPLCLSIFLLTTVPTGAVFQVRTQASVSAFLIASTLCSLIMTFGLLPQYIPPDW